MDALRTQSLDTDASLVVSWLLQQVMKMKRSPKHWLQVVQPQLDVVQKTHSQVEETNHPPKLSLEVGQLLHVAPKAQSLELFDQLFAGVEIPSESWPPPYQESHHTELLGSRRIVVSSVICDSLRQNCNGTAEDTKT